MPGELYNPVGLWSMESLGKFVAVLAVIKKKNGNLAVRRIRT
jgi:hypothetical protein